MAKIKVGTFKVDLIPEETLWYDRKRWLFLGLPWTFTKYVLTETKLQILTGFWKQKEDDVLLYRISDITFYQTLAERLVGVGTLCIMSSDTSSPETHLRHIKKARKVKDLLTVYVEEARAKAGVSTSEIVGVAKPNIPAENRGESKNTEVPPPHPHEHK